MSIKFSFGRLHWAVICISVILTIAAWQLSITQIEKRVEQRFNFLSNQLVTQISERMKRYEDALRTGVVAIQTQSNEINVEDWKRFSEALKITPMYPGINGIGVIYHVRPENLDDFVKNQKVFRPDFKIHPYHGSGENWPITYLEPLHGNEQAVGLDIAFEQHRINAAKKAVNDVLTKGRIEYAFLGVQYNVEDHSVVEVVAGSPAEKAGVIMGDVILSINELSLLKGQTLTDIITHLNPGDKIKIKIKRGNDEKILEAILGSR